MRNKKASNQRFEALFVWNEDSITVVAE